MPRILKRVKLSTKATEGVHTKAGMDTERLGQLGRNGFGTILGRPNGWGRIRMMRSFRPPRIPASEP